ncbi:LysR family transcriptional regulator [Gordonia sp. NB41Y]|uniref:LysR family transcriptional regulator n=1 Tax=Gordonia sp. NB41Y TaxID=875808 RepID=UPI0006B15507|nr:LysR family transcriptional regulator [Gordonia sp. NB41Y]WLP89166.1 LysR family transcriptional regulator [Gordonia sp. NB41Y]
MLDVSLRELEYVVAVDAERNFTRAARDLHMAQPALSQAIIRLERRLGVSLFERTSRRVETTRAGETLAREARDILERVRAAVRETTTVGRPELTVHVKEPALQTPRRLLGAVRAAHPQLALHQTTLPESTADHHEPGGHVSLTLGPPRSDDEAFTGELRSIPMRAERVGILLSPRHPLAGTGPRPTDPVCAAAIAPHLLVSIDDRLSRWNDWVTGWFASHRRRPRWTASTVFGIVAGSDMVADGSCVLICLESVADDAGPEFCWRPLGPTIEVTWMLNWHAGRSDSPELTAGVNAMRAYARDEGWLRGQPTDGQ